MRSSWRRHWRGDDLHAELAEIDENLIRHNLTSAQEAAAISRRKAIYLELHPETAPHVAGAHAANKAMGNNASEKSALAFTQSTSEATGKSRRSVEIAAARGAALGDDLAAIAGGAPRIITGSPILGTNPQDHLNGAISVNCIRNFGSVIEPFNVMLDSRKQSTSLRIRFPEKTTRAPFDNADAFLKTSDDGSISVWSPRSDKELFHVPTRTFLSILISRTPFPSLFDERVAISPTQPIALPEGSAPGRAPSDGVAQWEQAARDARFC